MRPKCSICWTTGNLTKCTRDDSPHLLCSAHVERYGGRCTDCWETGGIILPPRGLAKAKDVSWLPESN